MKIDIQQFCILSIAPIPTVLPSVCILPQDALEMIIENHYWQSKSNQMTCSRIVSLSCPKAILT
jgi:hypothetical protein